MRCVELDKDSVARCYDDDDDDVLSIGMFSSKVMTLLSRGPTL